MFLLRKSEKKKGSLLAMWLSPVPLALVGCALELALQPEDVGEEAAGRGLSSFTGLAPQWEISLPVQCLTNSLVQLPLPNSLRTEEEERWTNEYRKQNSFRQKKLQEKQQEAVGFPSAIQLAGLVSYGSSTTSTRCFLGSCKLYTTPMRNTYTSFKPDSHHH